MNGQIPVKKTPIQMEVSAVEYKLICRLRMLINNGRVNTVVVNLKPVSISVIEKMEELEVRKE
jgi:hypothetical protein